MKNTITINTINTNNTTKSAKEGKTMKKINITSKTIAAALAAVVMAGAFSAVSYADTTPIAEAFTSDAITETTDAPTSEEIAAMRTRSNKNAVKENKMRELERLLNSMNGDDEDSIPINPDAPTEEEIAAIREQNAKKQEREEMTREYERLKAELYGENETAELPADETDGTSDNTTSVKEVINGVVIITDTTANEDGTKTVVRTMTDLASGKTTATVTKYDADGNIIIDETAGETKENSEQEKKTEEPGNDQKKEEEKKEEDKKEEDKKDDEKEEDSWLGNILKDGLGKLIDKGIDKGLDYVFDNLLGGGDDGWMGIVKKLPWDQVCKTVCNIVDSSLGGDGSGNNGRYSISDIEKAFSAAYARAQENGVLTTTSETNGKYNIITNRVVNPDGTKVITQIITDLETLEKKVNVTRFDKDGNLVSDEEEKQVKLDALVPGTKTEKKEYSSDSRNTIIDTTTDVKDEKTAVITKEFKQYANDGSSVLKTVEITEVRNEDGTITTTKNEKTSSRMADYVRGRKVGYIKDETDITLTFTETAEEYIARMEKEQQEESQYGTLISHTVQG